MCWVWAQLFCQLCCWEPRDICYYIYETPHHCIITTLECMRLHCFGYRFSPNQGWGLLSQYHLLRYFLYFIERSRHSFPVWYHNHVWLQLSYGDTCQIWTRFEEYNVCLGNVRYIRKEIEYRNGNPHPGCRCITILYDALPENPMYVLHQSYRLWDIYGRSLWIYHMICMRS